MVSQRGPLLNRGPHISGKCSRHRPYSAGSSSVPRSLRNRLLLPGYPGSDPGCRGPLGLKDTSRSFIDIFFHSAPRQKADGRSGHNALCFRCARRSDLKTGTGRNSGSRAPRGRTSPTSSPVSSSEISRISFSESSRRDHADSA